MKTICWTILAAMAATGAVAQDTNTLPPIPAPVTSPAQETAPAPAVAPAPSTPSTPATRPTAHRKRAATPRRAALVEPTVTLVPGPAEVTAKNLNVRGQAGLQGEYLLHLGAGDSVTVLSEITLGKHRADEPAQWAKISFPTNGHVWVSARYIDPTNDTVLARKLNLRAGPGENYSVLGIIERGTPVSEITQRDGWMQIEPPPNTYAFVAAMYLKQEASETFATNPPPSTETETEMAMTTNAVTEPEPVVAGQTTETNTPATTEANSGEPEATETNTTSAEIDTNLPPRVVTHEGVVRQTGSLITPTEYELYNPSTDVNVDFLYTTATNLDLGRYVGMRINVTGTEGLAARWPDVPVLTIQRILVIDTNAVQQFINRSPKGAEQHR